MRTWKDEILDMFPEDDREAARKRLAQRTAGAGAQGHGESRARNREDGAPAREGAAQDREDEALFGKSATSWRRVERLDGPVAKPRRALPAGRGEAPVADEAPASRASAARGAEKGAAALPPQERLRRVASAATRRVRQVAATVGNRFAQDPARTHGARTSSGAGGYTVIHIPRAVVIGAGAALLAALLFGIGALERSCSSPETAQEVPPIAQEEQPPAAPQADFSNLPADLDEGVVAALEAQQDDPRIVQIVNNASALAVDWPDVQLKLLQLAAEDPRAIDYVAQFPERYPQQTGEPYGESVQKGTVPLLMQWDQRWGYTRYCGSALGRTGCCPTSLSMVYMGLTGKTDKTPYDMAVLAEQNGYAVEGQGSYAALLTDMAPSLGLKCWQVDHSAESLVQNLQEGRPVAVNVKPGIFTDTGHFFVAVGLTPDGKVNINDPYSSVRSAQAWDAQVISSESLAMYAFEPAE